MNSDYISNYNKNTYKQYIFRVRKDDTKTINTLDRIENKNSYFYNLINSDIEKNPNVLTLAQIRKKIKPILNKYGINDIYLFGSYARGEANKDSDVDIYCEKGNIKTFVDQGFMKDELEDSLNKKVDIIFNTTTINDYFKDKIMEDLIKLC